MRLRRGTLGDHAGQSPSAAPAVVAPVTLVPAKGPVPQAIAPLAAGTPVKPLPTAAVGGAVKPAPKKAPIKASAPGPAPEPAPLNANLFASITAAGATFAAKNRIQLTGVSPVVVYIGTAPRPNAGAALAPACHALHLTIFSCSFFPLWFRCVPVCVSQV